MKLPSLSVYWIDTAGVAVLALMTAGLYVTLIGPTLDQRAREDELNTRLTAMRSNLTALRGRNRQFEARIAEARAVVDAQPPLQPADALLTRRAAVTSLFGEHNLLLDEFSTGASDRPASRPGARSARPGPPPDEKREGRSFRRHTLVLRGEGAFPDIVAAASAVPQGFSDMMVEALDITGLPFGSSDQRQFTMTLVWYAADAPEAP